MNEFKKNKQLIEQARMMAVTQQQEAAVKHYSKTADEADGNYEIIPFKEWYVRWQAEHGLFDDSHTMHPARPS